MRIDAEKYPGEGLPSRDVGGKACVLIVFTLLITGLPLVGIHLSGGTISPYLSFPPLTVPAVHEPFSWPVFSAYLLLAVLMVVLFAVFARRQVLDDTTVASSVGRALPWWGWAALAVALISWFFAWTRISWFQALQRYTFIPLWFSYVVFANGLSFRQSGKCPMLDQPGYYALLFPVSAVFWWYFEYLNQFVRNWHYIGVSEGPGMYTFLASLSFSTVLPAVLATREWLSGLPWFRRRFYGLPPLPYAESRPAAWLLLILSCAGLAVVGLWPDRLFSLLWLAPLLILTALQHLAGERSILSFSADGDWRPVVSAAAAALLCGLFWEMWNFYSMAKWIYSIPYVYRFKVFDMPILGYLGYLPFGLECIAITELVGGNSARERKR